MIANAVIPVLLAAASAAGVTVVLSALLLLAERYLVNYGECTIDVNEGSESFEVTGGGTLLGSLKDQGIFIPSACGGKGTCAYCKVKVLEGGGPMSPTEEPLLTESELAEGVRISCQLKVREDMQIEIPEELFAIKQFSAKVEWIRDLTHDIKELRLALVDPPQIDLVDGQYIQLESPPYGDLREGVSRAYSVSSPSDEKDHVELIVRLVPGGICTTWVFEYLSEGDRVSFTGPYGDFGLTDNDNEMVWIAGGSGMAPFWAMLRHMKRNGIRRKCRYFFGAVTEKDMFFLDEMKQMEEELDWFEFIPALSGEDVGEEWQGEHGLITDVVGRHVEQGIDAEAYLCGSPGMIDASIEVLKSKGIGDDRIFYDKFA